MLFNLVDSFYDSNELGLIVLNFLNLPFEATHQSKKQYYGESRLQSYPCYETEAMKPSNKEGFSTYNIFKNTLEKKIGIKPFHIHTFFRKTKLEELQSSASWGQHRPHTDGDNFDFAGLIYYNSNSIKDGTNFYNNQHDFEPTATLGARYNRCVIYKANVWHAPMPEQQVQERWVQPFFLITEESTYKKWKDSNET